MTEGQPMRDRITAAALKLCAGRTTMTHTEFIDAMYELIEASAFSSPVKVVTAIVPPSTELRGPSASTPLQNLTLLEDEHGNPLIKDGKCCRCGVPEEARTRCPGCIERNPLLKARDVLPPQIKPQTNNRDLALARYRTKNPYDHPALEPVGSTLKKIEEETPKRVRTGPITEEEKDIIRQLARRARIGRARLPHGFAAQLAAEYDISESYIYSIIHTDSGR